MIFHSSVSLWSYMLLLDVLNIFYKTKFDAEKGLVSRSSRMDPEHCIYKVSKSIRDVKPQAYRPQVVLVGLHNRSINRMLLRTVQERVAINGTTNIHIRVCHYYEADFIN